jgi:glycerol-3-phosphate dehydrogenase
MGGEIGISVLREEHVRRLGSERFDVLVIGGGATGAGAALDAASRGLRVALVERDDFASGTSGRSTKLIHGGVRYLVEAVTRLSIRHWRLLRDALAERATLLRIAPHIVRPLVIITPLYRRRDVLSIAAGLKLYDWIAGRHRIGRSRSLSRTSALARCDMLRRDGLRGAVEYYDGQFDDARLNIALIMTAIEYGAAIANHAEVVELRKEGSHLCGVVVEDRLTGWRIDIEAKAVINATGPFADEARRLDDPRAKPMLTVSSGAHVVLDATFAPPDAGLLIPRTEDGRVLFLLPWLGRTLVGTTDRPDRLHEHPPALEEDIDYLLRHVQRYFDLPVARSDVRAAWAGLRPLVGEGGDATAHMPRDHIVAVSDSGLVTITGGKWTTYRRMAIDAVDEAIRVADLREARPSRTAEITLAGGGRFTHDIASQIAKAHLLDCDIATHLCAAYGDRAAEVATIGLHARLAPHHPFIEAEVVHAIEHEMAQTAMDVLARRTRLAFLDSEAAKAALPRVVELMAERLNWGAVRCEAERRVAINRLESSL